MRTYQFPAKYPEETKKDRYIDFSNRVLANETIETATVLSSIAGTVNNVQYAGTVVTWDVSGGTAGETIIMTILATGSMGSVLEAQATMKVGPLL